MIREILHKDIDSIQKEMMDVMKKYLLNIDTAVYGSYDCPEAWTLRRFRDYYLAPTYMGRIFIHTYYAVSPTLVKWFGETNWFKNFWKPHLDRVVNSLNNKGIADTPYNDIHWQ